MIPLHFVSPDSQSRHLALPLGRQPSEQAVVSDHWPEVLQVSTPLASQRTATGAQTPVHAPPTHAWLGQSAFWEHEQRPLLQVSGAEHSAPQAPQLAESLLVSMQLLPQWTCPPGHIQTLFRHPTVITPVSVAK